MTSPHHHRNQRAGQHDQWQGNQRGYRQPIHVSSRRILRPTRRAFAPATFYSHVPARRSNGGLCQATWHRGFP